MYQVDAEANLKTEVNIPFFVDLDPFIPS